MRVVLVTPHFAPSTRGNSITVQRIAAELGRAGCSVEVRSPDGRVLRPAHTSGPTAVVHGFHAVAAGPATLALASELSAPCVITLTGTDLFGDAVAPVPETTRLVLDRANAVVAFTPTTARFASDHFPHLCGKLHIIPQAPYVAGWPAPRTGSYGGKPDAFTLLHIAGIRPVKGNLFPIGPLERLRERLPTLRLLYLGPILDRPYAERLFIEIRRRTWVAYAGDLRHEQLPAILAGGDAALNTSESEGGMPNAILEAMWWGRPVVVSDVPGNRDLVEHGVTGLVYSGEEGFIECVERLASDPSLGPSLADAARRVARERFSPAVETSLHLRLYESLAARA
ncbi:MAG: glycosyltransferase family 4 protein [Candidatus Wallbacteria bacterium]|nr:glycosyltransferase family 4 protein [Candidatus Wallbacteria bacterium]